MPTRHPETSGLASFRVLALCLVLSAGCARKAADLTPTQAVEGTDLSAPVVSCDRDAQGHLEITIYNYGNKPAIATTTQVSFASLAPVIVPTRPILPGQSATLTVPIPDRCYSPTCHYVVELDARHEVAESDEVNNRLVGQCPAPWSSNP